MRNNLISIREGKRVHADAYHGIYNSSVAITVWVWFLDQACFHVSSQRFLLFHVGYKIVVEKVLLAEHCFWNNW